MAKTFHMVAYPKAVCFLVDILNAYHNFVSSYVWIAWIELRNLWALTLSSQELCNYCHCIVCVLFTRNIRWIFSKTVPKIELGIKKTMAWDLIFELEKNGIKLNRGKKTNHLFSCSYLFAINEWDKGNQRLLPDWMQSETKIYRNKQNFLSFYYIKQ